jgi:hypothetical protein
VLLHEFRRERGQPISLANGLIEYIEYIAGNLWRAASSITRAR